MANDRILTSKVDEIPPKVGGKEDAEIDAKEKGVHMMEITLIQESVSLC